MSGPGIGCKMQMEMVAVTPIVRLLLSLLVMFSLSSFCIAQLCLSSNVSPLEACRTTFTEVVDQDNSTYFTQCCPPHCLQMIASNTSLNSTIYVYGSYPYTGNSSICLAAIHAGLIRDEQGGWVNVDLFGVYHQQVVLDMVDDPNPGRYLVNGSYQPMVANVSLYEIFPFNSSLSSTSNNVTSLSLPVLSYVDSINIYNASTWPLVNPIVNSSYIVYGRGTRFLRQLSPYPARAQHFMLYVLVPPLPSCANRTRETFHILMGGKNDTHYMNDVWLAERLDIVMAGPLSKVVDSHVIQWYRLPPAPFTPRSAMSYEGWIEQNDACQNNCSCMERLWLIGGQTGHQCQLEQLGVCSDEIWQLTITRNASSPALGFSFTWATQPTHMSFSARCGATSINTFGFAGLVSGNATFLIGGQLSYNDTTCRQKITTVNDVWYSTDLSTNQWTLAPPPPFSPRRDLSAAHLFGINSVFGGITYQSYTVNESIGIARLTQAEIYTESWGLWCNVSDHHCVWLHSNDSSNNSSIPNYIMWTSPVPLVNAQLLGRLSLLGGRTSQQALNDWATTTPPLYVFNNTVTHGELLLNVTMINQPRSYPPPELLFPYLQDIEESRFSLPLSYTLEEAELNDVYGPFLAGCDGYMTIFTTTFYQSATQTVDLPNLSTPYLYQAASSTNTSRGWFDFNLQRHSYATGANIIGGGQSYTHYYHDWLLFLHSHCFPPEDPSFFSVLGNGTASMDSPLVWTCNDGYHLEPPREADKRQAALTCMNNDMWMDVAMNTVSRCVKDKLDCPFPDVNVGDELCVPPDPTIVSISVSPPDCQQDVNNQMSLINCPLSIQTLSISGTYFTQPLLVYVGGVECTNPALHDEHDQVICENDLLNDTECSTYGTGILCTIPSMMGYHLPIRLFSGTRYNQPSISSIPLLSFAAPLITQLESTACFNTSLLQLIDCPYAIPFTLTVTGNNFWIEGVDDRITPGEEPRVSLSIFTDVPCQPIPKEISPHRDFDVLTCTINASSSISLNTSLPILIKQAAGPVNLLFDQGIQQIASISFAACAAGSVDIGTKNASISPAQRCSLCSAGTSTNNEVDAPICYLCPPGTYSPIPGSANCTDCPINTYAPMSGLSSCLECQPNSYQTDTRQSECHVCDLNQYLVLHSDNGTSAAAYKSYRPASSSLSLSMTPSTSQAVCSPCLSSDEAICYPNGTVVSASSSSYLLVDQGTGSINSALCHSARCMSGSICLSTGTLNATNIIRTNLSIINCCTAHRLPANINPLCAQCQDGYTEWDAACIRCDWPHVNVGALIGMILLAWVLLWMLHRLPNDRYVATVSILFYFMQMTLLFFSSQQLYPVLGLFNLNLFGDWVERDSGSDRGSSNGSAFCLLPLSAMQKLILQSFMPVFAVLLLSLIGFTHLLSRQCLKQTGKRNGHGDDDGADEAENNDNAGHVRCQSSQCSPGLYVYQVLFGQDADITDTASLSPSLSSSSLQISLLSRESSVVSSSASSPSLSFARAPLSCSVSLQPYYHTLVRICAYGYNSMTVLTLSYFHCQSAGAWGSFMYDEPTIDCASDSYKHGLVLFVSILVLLVIAPLFLLCVLFYRYRVPIRQRVQMMHQHASSAPSSATAAPSTEQCSLAYNSERDESKSMVADRSPVRHQSTSSSAASSHSRWLDHLDILYGVYRQGYEQYAVVILVRRFVLILIFVFAPIQMTFVCLVFGNAVCWVVHALLLPYHRMRDNILEFFTLLCLLLQTTVIATNPLPWLVDVDNRSETGGGMSRVAAVLWILLLIVLPLLCILLSMCMDKYQAWHSRKQQLNAALELNGR